MNDIEKRIKEETKELIVEGNELIKIASSSGAILISSDLLRISAWIAKTGHLITSVVTKEDELYKQYSSSQNEISFYKIHSEHYIQLIPILGSLEALYNALDKGLLKDVNNFLRAEIFNDFLEMGEYLIKNGYKDPAAVLIAAVLEDSLRKIAIVNKIEILKDNQKYKTLEALNQDLYSNKVYDALIFKQITSWGELRNNATHGHFDKYNEEQVKMMLLFVQDFCSRYLT